MFRTYRIAGLRGHASLDAPDVGRPVARRVQARRGLNPVTERMRCQYALSMEHVRSIKKSGSGWKVCRGREGIRDSRGCSKTHRTE